MTACTFTLPATIMLKTLYVLAGGTLVTIGVWMLIGPASWYLSFPVGIADTGPFNRHFVQDIGLSYVLLGVMFAWCALHLARARSMHVMLTAYLVGHALLHATDLIEGRLPMKHWLMDTPSVFLPAGIMLLLAFPPVWRTMVARSLSPKAEIGQ